MPLRFRNNHPTNPTAGNLWRWQWDRWRAGLPKEPPGGYHFPVAEPAVDFLRANRTEATVTWIGHATVLLQLNGVNILTDPQFSPRASPLSFVGPRRRVPPIPALDQLPPIDAVVISHNHYDHLDCASVRRLAAQPTGAPRFFVPRGMQRWFDRQRVANVIEMDWWNVEDFCGLRFHCVPSHHWSARTSFDRNTTLWSGWVIEGQPLKIFFAGDTGYSPDFREIYRRLGPMDFAAIPIGHYEPRWFMGPSHVDPQEATQIAQDIHARCALGIHWGTFPLSDEPMDEPPRRLRVALEHAALAPDRFIVLPRGETRVIDDLLNAPPG